MYLIFLFNIKIKNALEAATFVKAAYTAFENTIYGPNSPKKLIC